MLTFTDYLLTDLKNGDLVKNLLFARTEYSYAFSKTVSHAVQSVSDLVRLANPMLRHDTYHMKLLKLEDKHTGTPVFENIGTHHADIVVFDKPQSMRFNSLLCIEKQRFLHFSQFSLLAHVDGKYVLLTFPKDLVASDLKEDEDFVYFPSSKYVLRAACSIVPLDNDKVLGAVAEQLLLQRIDEANEKLLVHLYERVLNNKLTFDVIFEGFRLLNAIMALKGAHSDLIPRFPFKGVKAYLATSPEVEVAEGLANSLRGSSYNPSLQLVVKNVRLLVSNPKQSFMLHMFALVTSQQSSENMGNTNTVMGMRDYLQRDYLMQVFSMIQENVFNKVSQNWDLSVEEINSTMDVMLGWTSVKTSSMGRFWKGRLLNNLIANCLMSFYLREHKTRADASNPTPEATSLGKLLFAEMRRVLHQRFALSALYAKL